MSKLVCALIGLVAGYGIGVAVGALLISLVSGNTHDKSQEIVMTAAFVTGPLGAIIGAIIGAVRGGRAGGGTTT